MQEGFREVDDKPSVLTFRFMVFLIIFIAIFAMLMTLLFFLLRG